MIKDLRLFLAFFVATMPTFLLAQWQVVGSASAVNSRCFEFTDTVNNQAGAVWHNQFINLNDPFEIYATVNFGNKDTNGGDGMAFLFQQFSLNGVSTGNGKLGYQGIQPSFGVEFDTRQNTTFNDPVNDHMSLFYNGTNNHSQAGNIQGPIGFAASNPNVEDGADHMIHIKWDPVNELFRVWFDCELRINYSGDIVQNYFFGDPNVYWGFTGGTGNGFTNQQSLCFDYINYEDIIDDTTLCAGINYPVQFFQGDSFAWSPSVGVTDLGGGAFTTSPPSTTDYTISVYDSCGVFRTAEFTHTVQDSNIAILSGDTVTCNGKNIVFPLSLQGSAPFNIAFSNGVSTQAYVLDQNGNVQGTNNPPSFVVNGSGTWTIVNFFGSSGCGSASYGSFTVVNNILDSITINASDVTCNGACDGSATIQIPHATPDYYYVWPNFSGGNYQANLCATTHQVTVNNGNGCQAIAPVTINEPTLLQVAPLADINACMGQNNAFSAVVTGGVTPYTYQWSTGASTANINVAPWTTTTYSVTVSDSNYCGPVVETFTINVYDSLEVAPIGDQAICEGSTINLITTANGGSGVITYSWSNGMFGSNIAVSPAQTTTYTVTVSDHCGTPPVSEQVTVEVDPFPEDTFWVTTPACVGKPITIETSEYRSDATYRLNMGNGDVILMNGTMASYTYQYPSCYQISLSVQTDQCFSQSTIPCAADVKPTPTASFDYSPDEVYSISAPTVTLTSTSVDEDYNDWFEDWSFIDEGLIVSHSFMDSGIYDVALVSSNIYGCADTAIQVIEVVDERPAVYFPNSFTPNGDGTNDAWGPVFLQREVNNYHLEVFNRWGNIVFETRDPEVFWDGTYASELAAQEVYNFRCSFVSFEGEVYKHDGQITLIRR